MSDLTILDLVANGTMDGDIAATLWSVADERRSFMTVAVPRFAGKSTVSAAILRLVRPGTPIHILTGDESQMEELARHPDGGYLVVGEFSRAPVDTYLWGAPVRKVFETVAAGFSLVTALHAPTVEEAYDKICSGNKVSDEDASTINYMVYIERHGESTRPPVRFRDLSEPVQRGRPFLTYLSPCTRDVSVNRKIGHPSRSAWTSAAEVRPCATNDRIRSARSCNTA